jgi:hypothetical protein
MMAGELALHQIILHPLMQRLDRQRFIVLPGKDDHRHVRSLL